MNNLKQTFLLLIFLLSISVYSQDYYWYKGNRVNLYADSTKLNITTSMNVKLSEILQEFNQNVEILSTTTTENNTLFYSVKLNSPQLYKAIINFLKTKEEIICVSLYYMCSENASIGTSSFFYVNLKREEDFNLLQEYVLQNNIKIVQQFSSMKTWYILTTTNNTLNSVEASNKIYETGLFAGVDPAFIFNFKTACANDPEFYRQWGLFNTDNPGIDINLCNAWRLGTTGYGVNVAVLDYGFDITHRELYQNFALNPKNNLILTNNFSINI